MDWDWTNCKDCIFLIEDGCNEAESKDGCYFGLTEEDIEFTKEYNKNKEYYYEAF